MRNIIFDSSEIGEEHPGEQIKKKVYQYDFEELLMSTKTGSPFINSSTPQQVHSKSEHSKNDISKESSESSDEEIKHRISHKEDVMKDPALFYDKEKAKIPDINIISSDNVKSQELQTPTPKMNKSNRLSRVCEDLDTNFDPNRTTHKYEVMRMNSAHSMSVRNDDEQEEQKKEETPAPRKSMMNEIASEKQKQATKRERNYPSIF